MVKLYELKDDWRFVAEQEALGIIIRKPIGPEKHLIVDWVRESFLDGWASETDLAISMLANLHNVLVRLVELV